MMPNTSNRVNPSARADFHGAAIIDAHGREIPITEDMIRDACEKLADAWTWPVSIQRQAG